MFISGNLCKQTTCYPIPFTVYSLSYNQIPFVPILHVFFLYSVKTPNPRMRMDFINKSLLD